MTSAVKATRSSSLQTVTPDSSVRGGTRAVSDSDGGAWDETATGGDGRGEGDGRSAAHDAMASATMAVNKAVVRTTKRKPGGRSTNGPASTSANARIVG